MPIQCQPDAVGGYICEGLLHVPGDYMRWEEYRCNSLGRYLTDFMYSPQTGDISITGLVKLRPSQIHPEGFGANVINRSRTASGTVHIGWRCSEINPIDLTITHGVPAAKIVDGKIQPTTTTATATCPSSHRFVALSSIQITTRTGVKSHWTPNSNESGIVVTYTNENSIPERATVDFTCLTQAEA